MENREQDLQCAAKTDLVGGDRLPGPSFWRAQVGVWLVYLVMIYTTFLPMASGNLRLLLVIKTWRTLFGFTLSSLLRFLYRRVVSTWSLPRITAVAGLGSVTLGAVWITLGLGVAALVNPSFHVSTALPQYPRDTLDYSLTLMAWSAGYFFVKYWLEWQAERERSLRAASSAQLAELQLLRYQLNPHFLFNALNSVRASIDEDAQRAKRMITALAEFLRYSLLSGEGEMVELREEILAIRNYLAIESIRFETKLEVQFDVDHAAELAQVPAFLVCPLVENAVKHGMRTSAKPLRLLITAKCPAERIEIQVVNSGTLQVLEHNGEDTGTGLRNVRERVAQIYGADARFELREAEGWVRAVLDLPTVNRHPVLQGEPVGRHYRG